MSDEDDDNESTMMSSSADNEVMEAALREDPSNRSNWLVYANWLQNKGSVLGELVVLQSSKSVAETEDFILQRRADIFEDCAEFFEPGYITQLEWHMGFLRGARLSTEYDAKVSLEELTDRFLRLPVTRFIRRLTTGCPGFEGDADQTGVIEAIMKSRRTRTLEDLFLGDFEYPDEQEMSWVGAGEVHRLWSLPRLQHLHVRGSLNGELGTIVAPSLRTFIRESGGMPAAEIDSVARASWPKLERLEIWTGSDGYGAEATVEMLAPIFQGRGLGNLKFLGIRNCEFADDVAAALAKAPVLKQLQGLDLSMGNLGPAGAQALVASAAAFSHLKLDLTDNTLAPEDAARIRAMIPHAILDSQSPDRTYEGNEGPERYCAVGE